MKQASKLQVWICSAGGSSSNGLVGIGESDELFSEDGGGMGSNQRGAALGPKRFHGKSFSGEIRLRRKKLQPCFNQALQPTRHGVVKLSAKRRAANRNRQIDHRPHSLSRTKSNFSAHAHGQSNINKKQRTIETTCLLRTLQVMITSTQPYLNSHH